MERQVAEQGFSGGKGKFTQIKEKRKKPKSLPNEEKKQYQAKFPSIRSFLAGDTSQRSTRFPDKQQ